MDREKHEKLRIIREAVRGRHTVREVARLLDLSMARVKQLKKAFREHGEIAITHRNSGRQPGVCTSKERRTEIIALKNSDAYANTNVAQFRKLLAENEGIKISHGTLSGILREAEIIPPKKHRKEDGRFKRKGAFGEMLLMGTCSHQWFGGREYCVLHFLVDDATKRITSLYFCRNECVMGYVEVLRQTITIHGIPHELYAKKAEKLFGNTEWGTPAVREKPSVITPLGRIVKEQLGMAIVDDLHAPHANARVEKLLKTMQRRIPQWLKNHGIADMERANGKLRDYIAIYNSQRSIPLRITEPAFDALDGHDPDILLAIRHKTTPDSDGCFYVRNFAFKVDSPKPVANMEIDFLFCPKGEKMFLAYHERGYHTVSFLGLKAANGSFVDLPDALEVLIQEECYASVAEQSFCNVNTSNRV